MCYYIIYTTYICQCIFQTIASALIYTGVCSRVLHEWRDLYTKLDQPVPLMRGLLSPEALIPRLGFIHPSYPLVSIFEFCGLSQSGNYFKILPVC